MKEKHKKTALAIRGYYHNKHGTVHFWLFMLRRIKYPIYSNNNKCVRVCVYACACVHVCVYIYIYTVKHQNYKSQLLIDQSTEQPTEKIMSGAEYQQIFYFPIFARMSTLPQFICCSSSLPFLPRNCFLLSPSCQLFYALIQGMHAMASSSSTKHKSYSYF